MVASRFRCSSRPHCEGGGAWWRPREKAAIGGGDAANLGREVLLVMSDRDLLDVHREGGAVRAANFDTENYPEGAPAETNGAVVGVEKL
jgi:hypothetical protein